MLYLGEELILDCTVMEVNRAVERYSLRKTFDTLQQQQDTTTTAIVGVGSSDDLPVSQPFLSHLNSSQVPNLVQFFIFFLFLLFNRRIPLSGSSSR